MSLEPVLDAFSRVPAVRDLEGVLPARNQALSLGGLPGSSPAVLVAWLARTFPQRLFAVVAPTPADGERWLDDLRTLTDLPAALYPQRESLGEDEPHYEIAGERIETIDALLAGRLRVLVTTARATAERTRIPDALAQATITLTTAGRRGDDTLGSLVERLEGMGYRKVPTVTEVAEFSVRGGILDVYGFGMPAPARLEWWGDTLESMRGFDLTSQRSLEPMDAITILPISGVTALANQDVEQATTRRSLLDLLPGDTVVIEESVGANGEEVERVWSEAEHHLEVARRLGEAVADRELLFVEPTTWRKLLDNFPRLRIRDDKSAIDVQFGFFPPERIDRDLPRLRRLLGGPTPTMILCDNEGQLERLDELLSDGGRRHVGATLALGALDGGFVMPTLRVLTDHEIFRRARRLRRARRYRQAAPSAATGSLKEGDYVVHLDHGIGVYRGIATIPLGGSTIQVAVLEYLGGDRLNVPLYRLDQLERYRGAGEDGDRTPPKLHKLGGGSWKRTRDKTREAIKEMAAELLDLYARRKVTSGYGFPPDTRWQQELESSFLYEDTTDQRQATVQVKQDMEQARPMDRLLVGDVGYGKTEIAVRATFKAIQGGKQVAVLVPTTILADQHGRTFSERLADFPVRVEVLSRFSTPKEQKVIVAEIAAGKVDVVIGTHRLLSKDVVFKDLGLLIVDEEHRFGVRHKERLKALRLSVDVLTLTATPIPRTLHLSLTGLRDITLIETAPRDRSPILTFVEPWDDGLIEEALARELDRGGQVFVVHNRVETIDTIGARIEKLAPRAEVAVAHGQMSAEKLERVMHDFVAGKVTILVSTMIVESGLDVPNANTLVVHDAHNLGLAQLYQLRGRVGRSHRRAYCYLLAPDTIDPAAEERLKILEHHTELGAGYRIALKDLEQRGAGNLLGQQQSGHAHAIGFDLYLRWLEESVDALRGSEQQAEVPPEVVLDLPAHLPDSYLPDDAIKLEIYRRLARAGSSDEITELRDELRERFGPPPAEVRALLNLARIRALGARLGLEHVLVRGEEARITFRAGASPRMAGLTIAMEDAQLRAEVRRMVPLSIRLIRLGGEPLAPTLVRALEAVAGTA